MKHILYLSVLSVLSLGFVACTAETTTSTTSSQEDTATVVETPADTADVQQVAEEPETENTVTDEYNEQEAKAFATTFTKKMSGTISGAKKFITPELYAKCKNYYSKHILENMGEEPYFAWGVEDKHITRPGAFVKSLGNKEFRCTLSEPSDFAGDEGGYSNITSTIIIDKVDGEYKVVNIYNYMNRRYEL